TLPTVPPCKEDFRWPAAPASGDKGRAVVGTDVRRSVVGCVEDADGVSLVHGVSDIGRSEPAKLRCLAARRELAAGGSAPEDQGRDAAREVLVRARECFDYDVEASLFADLAAKPVLDALVEFEDSPPGGSQCPLSRRWITSI